MTDNDRATKMHRMYWKGSPFYRSLYNLTGVTMDEGTAIYQAAVHGATLDELDVAVCDGRVGTLDLVLALGY